MSGWLPEMIAAADGRIRGPFDPIELDQLCLALTAADQLLVVAGRDDRPVGLLVLADQGAATRIDLLAIAAPARNLGFGTEAVYAAEALRPGHRFLAGVPLGNGLAIYFWLRAGYRPLYPSAEARDLPAGRIWMQRDASATLP